VPWPSCLLPWPRRARSLVAEEGQIRMSLPPAGPGGGGGGSISQEPIICPAAGRPQLPYLLVEKKRELDAIGAERPHLTIASLARGGPKSERASKGGGPKSEVKSEAGGGQIGVNTRGYQIFAALVPDSHCRSAGLALHPSLGGEGLDGGED
jgi:hypothetical protein